MLWDLYLEVSDRSDRCASPSLRQNLTIRRLIGNWNGARVQKNDQMQHRRRCECVSTAYPVEYGHIFAVIFCNPQLWWIHAEHRPIFFRAVSWRWDNRKIVLLQLSQCQWTNPDYPSSRESYPEGWWKNPNHDKRRQESVPIFLITCCTFARRVTKFEFCCSKCLFFFSEIETLKCLLWLVFRKVLWLPLRPDYERLHFEHDITGVWRNRQF